MSEKDPAEVYEGCPMCDAEDDLENQLAAAHQANRTAVEALQRMTAERDKAVRQIERLTDCGGPRMGPHSMPVESCGVCQGCFSRALQISMSPSPPTMPRRRTPMTLDDEREFIETAPTWPDIAFRCDGQFELGATIHEGKPFALLMALGPNEEGDAKAMIAHWLKLAIEGQ